MQSVNQPTIYTLTYPIFHIIIAITISISQIVCQRQLLLFPVFLLTKFLLPGFRASFVFWKAFTIRCFFVELFYVLPLVDRSIIVCYSQVGVVRKGGEPRRQASTGNGYSNISLLIRKQTWNIIQYSRYFLSFFKPSKNLLFTKCHFLLFVNCSLALKDVTRIYIFGDYVDRMNDVSKLDTQLHSGLINFRRIVFE